MKRLLFLLTCAAALAALAPAAAPAAPAVGEYDCYVFYSPGVPTFTGRKLKIVSAKKYSFFNSRTWKSGRYKRSGTKLRFRTGPLRRKTATHKVYGNGTHGIDLRMKAGAGGTYSCSQA